MTLIPATITLVRPALGVGVAVAVLLDNHTLGFWLYMGGQVSDLLDGLTARVLKATSAWGKDLDAVADALLNGMTGAALTIDAIFPSIEVARIALLLGVLAAHVGTRLRVRRAGGGRHSDLLKYLSGLVRVVLLVLLLARISAAARPPAIAACLLLTTIGGLYELRVTRHEVQIGERTEVRRLGRARST